MNTKIYIRSLFLFICLTCLHPGKGFAQLLNNTSWKAVSDLEIALRNYGIDTLKISFLPNNRMEFRYHDNNSIDTFYGTWTQLAPGYFKFQDTSNPVLSLLCDPADEAFVTYTIDTGIMHFANMQDSCPDRGDLFVDSRWAQLRNNTGVDEAGIPRRNVRIYPNPSSGTFSIDFHGIPATCGGIRVYNLAGQQVYSQGVPGNLSKVSIPLLPSGTYLVKIEFDSQAPFISRVYILD